MEYKGILKRRTKSRNLLILAVGAVLLLLECESKQYIYIPFTALIMVAVFHKKDHVVSEAGVDIRRSIFGMVSDNRWKWSEISAVQPDYIGANTKVTFQKGSMLRSFLFTPEDADAVLKLAASMNPEMFIDAYTEEEQEEMEREKRRREEQLRAQRAQAKRAKKKR